MSYGNGWRVRVDHHWNFALDQVNVWIAQRNELGEVRMVEAIHFDQETGVPFSMKVGDPIDAYQETPPTFTVGRELAAALFDALAPMMIGTDSANVLQTVANLRRERDDANRRFDEMLKALSNMNSCATHAPGKVVKHDLPSGNQP